MPPSCYGCGKPVEAGIELCTSCRTERVSGALGAERRKEPAPAATGKPPVDLLPRFIGRAAAMERLHRRFDATTHDGSLSFAVVTGGPGMGKSRLVAEFTGALSAPREGASPPVLALHAVCDASAAGPYAPFARIFGQRFDIDEEDQPEIRRDKILAAVSARIPGGRGVEVAHLIGELIGEHFPGSPVVGPLADQPTQLETRMFLAARRLCQADATVAPVVLAFDEVERASPETVNLLHYLGAGVRGPVLVVAAGRPSLFETHPNFGQGDFPTERIDLGPLEPDESADLLTEIMRPTGAPPQELLVHARQNLEATPRSVLELVRYLVESRVAQPTAMGWKIDRQALWSRPLPGSHDEILAARLHALPAGERDLLEKAAACGETFWLDALVAMVRASTLGGDPDGPSLGEIAAAGDRTRDALADTLDRLVERGLIVPSPRSSIPGETEYRFAYAPIWEIVHEGVAAESARRYHRLVAQWLELRPEGRGEEALEGVGRHLELAGLGDAAAHRYRQAGDAARALFHNDKAFRLYSQALQCLPDGDVATRIHLWHDIGTLHTLKGEYEPALAAFERMMRLSWIVSSRSKGAVAFSKMGRVLKSKGDLRLALDYLERSLDLFQQAGDRRGVAATLDDIGQVLWLLGRLDEAESRTTAGLAERRQMGDPRSIAVSLHNLGNILRDRGHLQASEERFNETLHVRRQLDDRAGVAITLRSLGRLRFSRGDVDGARLLWQEALEISEHIGALPLQGRLLSHLGRTALERGNLGEARRFLDEAMTLGRDLDDRLIMADTTRNLGLLEMKSGNLQIAKTLCRTALDLAERTGHRDHVGRALLALGEVHSQVLLGGGTGGETSEAEGYFQRGVEVFRTLGARAELARGLLRHGRHRIESGDTQGGRAMLDEARSIFSELGLAAETRVEQMVAEL